MRFVYDPYMISIDLDEGDTCILQIENRRAYTSFLSDLYMLLNYGEGDAALYDGEDSIDLKKFAEIIFEPFSLDFNNKRIKAQLYQLIAQNVNDSFYQQYLDLCENIQSFIGFITADVQYSTTFENKYGIEEMLKLCNVSLDYPCDSIAEKISVYIKLMASACKIKIFFFVGIERFINENEMDELIKLARYEKINIFFICCDKIFITEHADIYILDDSLCFWKA